MIIIRDISRMSKWSKSCKKKAKSIGFVPTMGYLHEGHLSLIRRARKDTDKVVVSIFVNPIQFGPREDFKKYPRNLNRDCDLAKSCGTDVIFYPNTKKMYPPGGSFLTSVDVSKLTEPLCGRSRPGHFRGVTTVVSKLFNIVGPDIAYFGQKDFQQAMVIQKMVEDLNFPTKIRILPIVRESDGLAISSRNVYLSQKQRKDALVLSSALKTGKKIISSGEKNANVIKSHIKKLIKKRPSIRIDYIEVVDADTLKRVNKISKKTLIAIATCVGKTRLIDNIVVKV